MKLVTQKVDTLPRLAWCAIVRRSHDSVLLLHGPWVETSSRSFFEGVWDGSFKEGPVESSICMGSGGIVRDGRLLVFSPDHTLDRIHLIKRDEAIIVSNSLVFALEQAHAELDPQYILYECDMFSIVDGIKRCVKSVPIQDGGKLLLYYHTNISIDPYLDVIDEPKDLPADFTSYHNYVAFLSDRIQAMVANATDSARKVTYKPLATTSTGYDSPAVAVLAKLAGCREALTFAESRRNRKGGVSADSGESIAKQLGIKVSTHGRLDYLRQKDFPEAENSGHPLEFSSLAPSLAGRLFFTGFHGGRVWDRKGVPTSDIASKDASGSTFTEFRLRVGFAHIPVPFLGCVAHPSIHQISNSDEMAPWCLMNDYDRPIPRRLVEEAGVARANFGQSKKAIAIVVHLEGLEATMTPSSFADFSRFCQERWNLGLTVKSTFSRFVRFLYVKNEGLRSKVRKRLKKIAGVDVAPPMLIPRMSMTVWHVGKESLLFHWAVDKLAPQYRVDSQVPGG